MQVWEVPVSWSDRLCKNFNTGANIVLLFEANGLRFFSFGFSGIVDIYCGIGAHIHQVCLEEDFIALLWIRLRWNITLWILMCAHFSMVHGQRSFNSIHLHFDDTTIIINAFLAFLSLRRILFLFSFLFIRVFWTLVLFHPNRLHLSQFLNVLLNPLSISMWHFLQTVLKSMSFW